MRIFNGKRKWAAGAALAVVASSGVAVAYWTQGGTGTGNAATGTTTAVTVNQTSTITGLYPGEAPVTLSGDFNNPNSGPVYVSSVTAVVHTFSSQLDNTKPACTDADFAIAGSAPVGAEIGSGNSKGAWTGLTIQLVDNPSANQDNCKGLSTIQIDYTANP